MCPDASPAWITSARVSRRDWREPLAQKRLSVDWCVGDRGTVLIADPCREGTRFPT